MWPFDVSISFREGTGLALVFVGLVLTPIAWMWSGPLWFLALALYMIGIALFLTDRILQRMKESDAEGGEAEGNGPRNAVPTDIHDYTGWGRGGRSINHDSHSEHTHGDSHGSDGGGDGGAD
jgi:hypothetical protein